MEQKEKLKALLEAYMELAECCGSPSRGTMESLLGIFGPEELMELGFREQVLEYLEEYGSEEEFAAASRWGVLSEAPGR